MVTRMIGLGTLRREIEVDVFAEEDQPVHKGLLYTLNSSYLDQGLSLSSFVQFCVNIVQFPVDVNAS